jgi:hypothetical protein
MEWSPFDVLSDFFIDKVFPRLRGHKATERDESIFDTAKVSGEDIGDQFMSEALIRHICDIERQILQGKHLPIERPEGLHGTGTAIEPKPGDEVI